MGRGAGKPAGDSSGGVEVKVSQVPVFVCHGCRHQMNVEPLDNRTFKVYCAYFECKNYCKYLSYMANELDLHELLEVSPIKAS